MRGTVARDGGGRSRMILGDKILAGLSRCKCYLFASHNRVSAGKMMQEDPWCSEEMLALLTTTTKLLARGVETSIVLQLWHSKLREFLSQALVLVKFVQ